MSRKRKSKRKKKKNATRHTKRKKRLGTVSSCRELILVDSTKLRKKLQTDLKRARTYHRKAEKEWNQFVQEIQPAYSDWMRKVQGDLPRRIAEENAAGMKASIELEEAEMLAAFFLISVEEAYARQQDMRDHPEEYPNDFGEEGTENDDWEEDPFSGNFFEEDYWEEEEPEESNYERADEILRAVLSEKGSLDEFRDFAEEALGISTLGMNSQELKGMRREFRKDFEREYEQEKRGKKPKPVSVQPEKTSLKSTYRQIAKALHPDAAEELTPVQERLWHEAQDAYQQKDESRLGVIMAHIRLETEPTALQTCSDILLNISFFRQSRISLRKTIQRSKKSPAWTFWKLSPEEQQREAATLRQELEFDFKQVESESRALQQELKRLKRKAKRFDVKKFRKEAHQPVSQTPMGETMLDIFLNEAQGSENKKGSKNTSTSTPPPPPDSNQTTFNFF